MLDELLISNIGGLSSAKLKLTGRFIVITGESGAGKSSIVRAIELISGKRAQTSMIRNGENQATTRAVLTVPESSVPSDISDLAGDCGGTVFVSRTISRSGKGRNTIQECPVPLFRLANFTESRIRIQSQFAQLDLLSQEKQLSIIDKCGGYELAELLSMLRETFLKAIHMEKTLRELKKKQTLIIEKYKDADVILEKLKKLPISSGCDKTWEKDVQDLETKISSARRLKDILLKLEGTDLEEGLWDLTQALMSELCDFAEQDEKARLDSLLSTAVQATDRFVSFAEGLEDRNSLPELERELEEAERKTGLLRTIMRKAKLSDTDEVIRYAEEAGNQLHWLSESYHEMEIKEKESINLRKQASEIAIKIRQKRKSSAEHLKTRVNEIMGELAMSGMTFDIDIKELDKLKIHGADEVSFLLRSSEGTSGPVDKLASGGELSRILLSIQVSLPDTELPDTIVFDEVEAGLGGKAAVLAGYKLKQLSEKCQVILITHEASIASIADQHFVIRREGYDSLVEEVTGENRVGEIARMLSGDYNLSEAREHAKKLLEEDVLKSFPNNMVD